MKSLIVTFLILLQLALQIGVPIHTHFCEMDGVFASVLLKVDHQCAEPHADLPPCCQKEKPKKDCCSDEVKVIKTTLDQIHSSYELGNLEMVWFAELPARAFAFQLDVDQNLFTSFEEKVKRPPPLWRTGRQIQTLHQTWQI